MRTWSIAEPCRRRLTRTACCISFAGAFLLWTGSPQAACRADTLRIARHPIAISEQNLAKAARSRTGNDASRPARAIALVNSSFSTERLGRYGWRVAARTGDIVTLHGDAGSSPLLGALDGVRMVKRPSRVHPLMDTVRKYCTVDQVHGTRDTGIGRTFTGAGVLFGIIDTDFDVHHPAFADSTGRTRFLAVWDQNDSSGTVPNRFGYGCIKDRDGLEAD
ncbi:MAG: hypothetical protein JXA71_08390, partial [Chitinispirillaceae bacterium]|nr:hypothetical protein [Chitinispirillaceae bacterium]